MVPRVNCREHGVRQVRVPWAEAGSRFTALFEALAIDWMKEASVQAVTRLLDISWNAADGIMQRAVARGMKRREETSPEKICIDEVSFRKRHDYVTVIGDPVSGHVLRALPDRTRESLDLYLKSLSEEKRHAIKTISMDMWPAYIGPCLDAIPDAEKKICFDKFHVAEHLGDAVDKVRREEHRALRKQGDDTLTGSKYDWLTNPENMSQEDWRSFQKLRNCVLKTARAWEWKEWAMALWGYSVRGWAEKAWKKWLASALRTTLQPVKKVARRIQRHLYGIINAIVHNVTNGPAESLNSKIKTVKMRCRGFRNKERFQNAIYFHLGGLDLYPEGIGR
jgi:transposase